MMKEDYIYLRIKKETLDKIITAFWITVSIMIIIGVIFYTGYETGKQKGFNDLHEELYSKEQFSLLIGNCYNGCSYKTFNYDSTNKMGDWRDAISRK